MAFRNWKIITIAFTVIALWAGCGLKKMIKKADSVNYTVEPSPLEVHGDSIAVTIAGTFPEKYFHKKATAEVTPMLKYDGQEKAFGAVHVHGEKVEGQEGATISHQSGGNFTYSAKIPYEPAMKQAELELHVVARKGNKEAELPTVKLTDGTITTSLRVQDGENATFSDHGYDKDAILRQRATIQFQIQRANIRNSEKSGEQMNVFRGFAKKHHRFRNVDIQAAASPDGPYDLNEGLANNRAKAAFNYIMSDLDKANVKQAGDSAFYKITTISEDWNGLLKAVEAAEDFENKDKVLQILRSGADNEAKERQLKEMSKTWNGPLAKNILPPLRRADIDLNAFENPKTTKEITTFIDSKPDTLNANEMLYAAHLQDNLDRKLSIYEQVMKSFPDDPRGYNSAGVIHLRKANTGKAQDLFNKAKAKADGDHPYILNNLACLAMLNGDKQKAKSLLDKAKKLEASDEVGNKINYNLATLAIHKGDYEQAMRYFGNACTYNASLAKLLSENYDPALKTIECADNNETAEAYYLRAIIGARNNNTSAVTANLQEAIKRDAAYKNEAKNDLEFANYFDNQDFKSIVN